MPADGSVSGWIESLKAGAAEAAGPLWQRYVTQILRVARRHLPTAVRGAADEEDVAQSAFLSFCRGVEEGKFPCLDHREDLWHILAEITARKAAHLVRAATRQKRGGPVAGESPPRSRVDLELVLSREPTAEDATIMVEQLRLLLKHKDDSLFRVAVLKLEGYSNHDIAARLDCLPRTVSRKIQSIRELWQNEEEP